MKINEILTESSFGGIWYHGSKRKFDVFDKNAERENRGTNLAGVYMTQRFHNAESYLDGDGYIYELSVNVFNPWKRGVSNISQRMCDVYSDLLDQNYNYNKKWIDGALVPSFKETGRFEDIHGWIKTAVLESGGYDCWLDGEDLVVFSTDAINIIDRKEHHYTKPEYKAPKRPLAEPAPFKSSGNTLDDILGSFE